MFSKIIARIKSYLTRHRKAKDMWGYLNRWDAACARSWAILTNGEPSIERFNRWERNHGRLLRLLAAKRPGEGGRITEFLLTKTKPLVKSHYENIQKNKLDN